nr:hypothetical protein [uncultured Fluviicola sp.]
MKKSATFFLVVMLFTSSSILCQTEKEITVKLEWQEQTFFHFYSNEYDVYVGKPEFLDLKNELLAGLFDEFAQAKDSINLTDPFSSFKVEHQKMLWNRLTHCASEGHLLIFQNDSKRKLKTVVILDDNSTPALGDIWECRDPKNKTLIFSHNVFTSNPNF